MTHNDTAVHKLGANIVIFILSNHGYHQRLETIALIATGAVSLAWRGRWEFQGTQHNASIDDSVSEKNVSS